MWAAEVLSLAARHLGPWARLPDEFHPHRWRYGRLDRGAELAEPLRLVLDGGQRLGLAGDLFAPGGGVQAAWLSGHRLAERFLEEA